MTNISIQTSFAGKSLENSLACPLIWAPPALAWFGALATLEKAPGSPMVEMTLVSDCEGPHPKNWSHQGGPELTVSWGKLSNDSFSRRNQKPPMVVSLFWRWSKTWFAPSIGSPTLPYFGCLHWGSLRLEEIVTLGGCGIKRMCKVNEIQVPGERIKLASYEKSQCWR